MTTDATDAIVHLSGVDSAFTPTRFRLAKLPDTVTVTRPGYRVVEVPVQKGVRPAFMIDFVPAAIGAGVASQGGNKFAALGLAITSVFAITIDAMSGRLWRPKPQEIQVHYPLLPSVTERVPMIVSADDSLWIDALVATQAAKTAIARGCDSIMAYAFLQRVADDSARARTGPSALARDGAGRLSSAVDSAMAANCPLRSALTDAADSVQRQLSEAVTARSFGAEDDLLQPILFDFADSSITDTAAVNRLSALGSRVTKLPEVEVFLVGFADPSGRQTFNDSLSFARARAVGRVLERSGVAAKRISISGRGASDSWLVLPKASKNAPGARLNRRVTISLGRPDSLQFRMRTR